MNDKELDTALANRVVALGIGLLPEDGLYSLLFADTGDLYTAEMVVRDWRVAGALMEKCGGSFELCPSGKWQVRTFANIMGVHEKYNESLPRAIIEACVDALDAD